MASDINSAFFVLFWESFQTFQRLNWLSGGNARGALVAHTDVFVDGDRAEQRFCLSTPVSPSCIPAFRSAHNFGENIPSLANQNMGIDST